MLALREFLAMRVPLRLALLAAALLAQPTHSQTYTTCNPTEESDCPPDPALGKSISVDFKSGESSEFEATGSPTYSSSNGAAFTISGPGDAPQIASKNYIMFGKYEVTMKVAPGAGIVSSIVLQSDDLDEIDWEFLGATPEQGQTNYFGKGQTTSWDRGGLSAISDSTDDFHTYGVEWTEDQIVWSVDGQTARVLLASDADDQYPQTPCVLKIGAWAGGDPSNAPGTISWAHGPTDYADGPFTMYVQSLTLTDYSTGTEYEYGNESGEWSSIEAVGGRVNGNAGASGAGGSPAASGTVAAAPGPVSATTAPAPWGGGLGGGSGATQTATFTSYPGLPSGWHVNPNTGKVIPPSAAPAGAVPVQAACVAMSAALGVLLMGVWL